LISLSSRSRLLVVRRAGFESRLSDSFRHVKSFNPESMGKIKPMGLFQGDVGIQTNHLTPFDLCILIDPVHQLRPNPQSSMRFIDDEIVDFDELATPELGSDPDSRQTDQFA
jgi:hypothetical protein